MKDIGIRFEKHCLNCLHSEYDPEVGYCCNLNLYNEARMCSSYEIDIEFMRKNLEEWATAQR